MTKDKFENIRTYPDYGEYVIGGAVILFFIFMSKILWTSVFLIVLLLFLMWFRVRLIKFNEESIAVIYPFRFLKRKRNYTYSQVKEIQVMNELIDLNGSAKISFSLDDRRKIVLRYDSHEFKKIISLIGSNSFNHKVKVGTESLYKKAKANPEAKVIREYVPKR